jgi:methylated-DNA-[protein]-cysteine S-methyltransferase
MHADPHPVSRPMMSVGDRTQRYCVFETALGACGIAWSDRGLTQVRLPEPDAAGVERRLRKRSGASASDPAPVADVIAEIRRYFAGGRVEFTSVALDLSGADPFDRAVYDAARSIGWGRTTTYGELACQIDAPEAARDVGQALGRNPLPLIVPCHRIVAKGKGLGGFSAPGGVATKIRLLRLEGFGADEPALPGF